MAMEMTGSGNSMRSSTIGWFSAQSVSPVVTFFSPAMRADLAGVQRVDLLAVVGVQLQQPA